MAMNERHDAPKGMAMKTRDKLIEVARQLFAHQGVENTTMLDIANASDKGRRTIYTYFKNKREIHQAVIERESEQIVSRQRQILGSDLAPVDKLREFLSARFSILTCPPQRRGLQETLLPLMRLDMTSAKNTRRLAARKEMEILREILSQGVVSGDFSQEQSRRMLPLVVTLMQGIDAPDLLPNLEDAGTDRARAQEAILDFIICGIAARKS